MHLRTTGRKFSCFLTNIRSLMKNINAYAFLLTRSDFDILCITETWLGCGFDVATALGRRAASLEVLRCDRLNRKGGGVAMFIQKKHSPVLIFKESIESGYDILCCDITIRFAAVRLLLLYRAPSCSPCFTRQMYKAISDLISCDHPTVVMGDFNLPDIDWRARPNPTAKQSLSKSFLEMCESHSLEQLVDKCTLGNNILDLVLSNRVGLIDSVVVGPPIGSSDHSSVTFKMNLPKESDLMVAKRDYSTVNLQAVANFLANVDWYSSLDSLVSVNDKYEMFIAILQHAIALFIPMIRVPPSRSALPGFLNSLYIRVLNAWKVATNTGSVKHRKLYDKLRIRFERKLAKYNKSIERKVVESNNKSAFFKFLKHKLRPKHTVCTLVNTDGRIARSDFEKAELLADSFAQVFTKDSEQYVPDISPRFPVMPDSVWFHADELYGLLHNWPPSYSLTPDDIPLIVIKNIAHIIAGPLEYIYNLSLMRAEVPLRWRISYVTPIPKKDPLSSPSNYRPISITSVFARLFEKVLKDRITKHLNEFSIIPSCQHGFQKGKSTITAMLQCLNDWTLSLDGGEYTDVIYLDFEKAFDRVSHSKLMCKLRVVGIHPRIISWIQAFLGNRFMAVRVNSTVSEFRSVTSGVPQGAVLSPVLFNIYTYDLPELIIQSGVKCVAFADDIKLYMSISTPKDCILLQQALNQVIGWSAEWGLPLSSEKTKLLHIGRRNARYDYLFDGVSIAKVDQTRDLGFFITRDLSFDSHCERIAATAHGVVHRLFRALSTDNPSVLLRAYKSYVRPLLEYGTVIFNPSKIKIIKLLESVQNSFTRKLLVRRTGFLYDGLPSSHTRNFNLRLPTLEQRRKKFDLIQLHKIIVGGCGIMPSELLTIRPSLTRGATSKLIAPKAKLSCRTNFFVNRAVSSYVKFSKNKIMPSSINAFRNMVNRYLGP